MAQLLEFAAVASATGPVACAFAAEPAGGCNMAAALGTATAAVVQLQARVGAEWFLADTLTLPDPNSGATALQRAIYPPYKAVRWNVVSVTGGNINLNAIGVGV